MANDMNKSDMLFESGQQMGELRDLSSWQRQHVKDEITIEMKEMIDYCGDGFWPPDCCIYRAPITLRCLKKEAFTPKLVSIGPFYHGFESLQDMESHKQVMFKRFTQRAMSSLEVLISCVEDLEPKVRASYSETINLTEKQLVKLTLMDAAFIIQFFIIFHEKDKSMIKDAKFYQPWLWISIVKDLLLVENQLPFFVIEEIFNKAFPHRRRDGLPSFPSLACSVFESITKNKLNLDHEVKIMHFTDLVRLSYLKGKMIGQDSTPKSTDTILRYNANALREAGIKLEPSESKCLPVLEFSGRVLKIPQIMVSSDTELLLLNMIALEQCHYPYDTCITDYAVIMDCLIDTDKDVDILVRKQIFKKYFGDSNNVASIFNSIGANAIQFSQNHVYRDICKRLNGYCEDPCRKVMSPLWRDYFKTRWHTAASIAGIILLLLTIVQTIFSIL